MDRLFPRHYVLYKEYYECGDYTRSPIKSSDVDTVKDMLESSNIASCRFSTEVFYTEVQSVGMNSTKTVRLPQTDAAGDVVYAEDGYPVFTHKSIVQGTEKATPSYKTFRSYLKKNYKDFGDISIAHIGSDERKFTMTTVASEELVQITVNTIEAFIRLTEGFGVFDIESRNHYFDAELNEPILTLQIDL